MQPDLRCYYHPERQATGQCDRCGDYLCAQCVRAFEDQQVCEKCFKYLSRPELPRGARQACVLNVAGPALLLAVWCVIEGLELYLYVESDVGSILGLLVTVLLDLAPAVFALAAVLAVRGSGPVDHGARYLRRSIVLTSFAVLCIVSWWRGPPWFYRARLYGPTLVLSALRAPSLVLVVISMVYWVQAVRKGVGPLWAIIVSFIPPFLGISIFGLQALAMIVMRVT